MMPHLLNSTGVYSYVITPQIRNGTILKNVILELFMIWSEHSVLLAQQPAIFLFLMVSKIFQMFFEVERLFSGDFFFHQTKSDFKLIIFVICFYNSLKDIDSLQSYKFFSFFLCSYGSMKIASLRKLTRPNLQFSIETLGFRLN